MIDKINEIVEKYRKLKRESYYLASHYDWAIEQDIIYDKFLSDLEELKKFIQEIEYDI